MKNLEQVARKLTFQIEKRKPKSINEKWVKKYSRASYRFVKENNLGWDSVTKLLDRSLQRKWNKGLKKKVCLEYFDEFEVDAITKKFKQHLYTFIIYRSKAEFEICDEICIKLVRLAQNGNVCAKERLINSCEDIFNKWMEYYKLISRWRSYEKELPELFEGCIKRYRYSGTFLGYLKRTLELQALALPKVKIVSLNYVSKVTGKEFHETLVVD